MIISKLNTKSNQNYLGYDEDSDGDWYNFFKCPNKKCNDGFGYNYITSEMQSCPICSITLEWVDYEFID